MERSNYTKTVMIGTEVKKTRPNKDDFFVSFFFFFFWPADCNNWLAWQSIIYGSPVLTCWQQTDCDGASSQPNGAALFTRAKPTRIFGFSFFLCRLRDQGGGGGGGELNQDPWVAAVKGNPGR